MKYLAMTALISLLAVTGCQMSASASSPSEGGAVTGTDRPVGSVSASANGPSGGGGAVVTPNSTTRPAPQP
jgi:hypothetical protein